MKTLRMRLTWGVVATAICVAASAAPEDDFKRALEVYSRGDVVSAISILRAPAQAGHAPSQTKLGFILEQADFLQEAVDLYRRAAAQDFPDGHAALGNLYVAGRGVAKDEKLALQHFSKAADLGHAKSIDLLAEAHLNGTLGLGSAAPEAIVAAVQRAAAQKHLPSVDALAESYKLGRWGLAPNPELAAQWAKRAADIRLERRGNVPSSKKGSR